MPHEKHVNFTNNPINATQITGGFVKWRLTGAKVIDPPNVTTTPFNLKTRILTCWPNNGKKKQEYEFQGEEELSYDGGETVVLSGPTDDIITLDGEKGESSEWKLKDEGGSESDE